MSVSVRQLNGDSTFLLSFSPLPEANSLLQLPSWHHRHIRDFTVLVDPWLTGSYKVYHSKFAFARHTVPSAIQHLSELDHPPDVVLISQDKPDHCNEATLRQLDPLLPQTTILAQGAAAKKIKSWKWFDPAKVHSLPVYTDAKANRYIRIQIPSPIRGAESGEVTISFMAAKRDLTGLHNALGITYHPPAMTIENAPRPRTSVSSRHYTPSISGSSAYSNVDSQSSNYPPNWPLSSPGSPTYDNFGSPSFNSPSSTTFSRASPVFDSPAFDSSASPRSTSFYTYQSAASSISSLMSLSAPNLTKHASYQHLPLPSACEQNQTTLMAHQSATSLPLAAQTHLPILNRAPPRKTLSVLYAPHGISFATLLPYVTTHLIPQSALPLTLLLHSFDRVQNPWYMGGNVSAGMPGGVEIARKLMARHWFSAHDEDKDTTGIAVWMTVTRKYGAEDVKALVEADGDEYPESEKMPEEFDDWGRRKRKNKHICDVRLLGCGREVLLSA